MFISAIECLISSSHLPKGIDDAALFTVLLHIFHSDDGTARAFFLAERISS